MKKFIVAQSASDLERFYPVIKELRPHLSYTDYISIYEESLVDHYKMVAIEVEGEIVAVMGYRLLSDYVRGKHVYVDDLVTSERVRSNGYGAELLKYAEDIAKSLGLKSLRLCTGIENNRGVSFYEKNGWTKRAFAFSKKL